MDRAAAEAWIRAHVEPVGAIETARERPWATVLRVPIAGGVAWFKACSPVQAFEPRLTVRLFARWPDRVAEVLGHDEERAWLLLADAGTPIGVSGNSPEAWLVALPLYAELQRGEAAHAQEHLTHDVPDLRVETLPARYEDLLEHDLPLESDEIGRLRGFAARFAELCAELAAHDVPETVQHDDLHMANVYAQGERLRLLDWGDASISHPFASLVVTFRFLEEINKLPPADPWFTRLRDAYLEPWGRGHAGTFALAIRVGTFAHAFAWARQRDALPEEALARFDTGFAIVLRRAVAQTLDTKLVRVRDWEQRLSDLWASFDDLSEEQFLARMEELAAELPADSAEAAFERASALDSTGHSDLAVPLYQQALELGLEGEPRRRAVIQLASSLRNLGRAAESVALLTAEREAGSDELDDAVSAFLALALVDTGREREAVSLALTALSRHLPRYQRSLANYAQEISG